MRRGGVRQAPLFQTTLVRDYVCAQCHAPLSRRPRPDGQRGLEVVCTQDAGHRGFWRKTTVEIRRKVAVLEAYEIVHDPTLRQAMPWLPQPEPVDARKALAELYDS
jgi:hypothetical protein